MNAPISEQGDEMPEYLEITVDKFTFRVAKDRLYTPEGLWMLPMQAGQVRVRVGVTDFFQQHNGDITFAHIKPQGTQLRTGGEFAEIETMKVTIELPLPFTGTIIGVNAALEKSPEVINQDPYDSGWLALIEPENWEADRAKLLDAEEYLSTMQSQAEEELKS
jgi:glycine cleavage system H protein